jgi:hypothetical protein
VSDKTPFSVRDATAEDAPGIRRLFQKVFGTALSPEEWSWKFDQNPDGWYSVVGVLDDTREIVGHYAGWSARFQFDGESRLLYSVGDVATDPAVRGYGGRRGVYRAMTEHFYGCAEREGVPFCYGFPNPRALTVSERIVGSRTLMPVRLMKVPIDDFREAPADAGFGDFVDESFDPLWDAARHGIAIGPVRDRRRVNWRFHARPNRYYRMIWRREGSEMIAWAVLSVGDGVATVVDYLGRDARGAELPALFDAAADEARRLGAAHLAFWIPPGGPGRETIESLPGERLDAGFPIIVRVFDEDAVQRFGAAVHLVPSLYDVV